jgi:hypothetical protein
MPGRPRRTTRWSGWKAGGHVRLLVTQNVDGLHDKAGSKAGWSTCMGASIPCVAWPAASVLPRGHLQQELMRRNPSWATLDALSAPDGDADLEGLDFAQFDVPDCRPVAACSSPTWCSLVRTCRASGSPVRAALAESDAVLVAGSSLMVYSGYRFVEDAVAAGKPVAAVNIGRTRADPVLSLKLECEVGVALQALASDLALAI